METKPHDETNSTANNEGGGTVAMLDWRGACAMIGGSRPISRSTLDKLTRQGLLKVCRPAPGVVRWRSSDIAAYLNSVTFPRIDRRAA